MKENDNVRVTFFYNKEVDKEVHEWLNQLPERRRSEYIRQALKMFINTNEGNNTLVDKVIREMNQRMNELEKKLENNSEKEVTEEGKESEEPVKISENEDGIKSEETKGNNSEESSEQDKKEEKDAKEYVEVYDIINTMGK